VLFGPQIKGASDKATDACKNVNSASANERIAGFILIEPRNDEISAS